MKLYMDKEELNNMKATAISVATENGMTDAVKDIDKPVAEETRYGYLLIGDDLKFGIKEDPLCDIFDAIFDILNGYQETINEMATSVLGIIRAFDLIGFYNKFLAK